MVEGAADRDCADARRGGLRSDRPDVGSGGSGACRLPGAGDWLGCAVQMGLAGAAVAARAGLDLTLPLGWSITSARMPSRIGCG